MKTKRYFFGLPALLLAVSASLTLGLAFAGCSTTTGNVEKVGWSNYTAIPNKDYTVVGVVIVRSENAVTLNADLMAEAVKLGADDIINVRVDAEVDDQGKQKIVAASAVAIKYTETLTSSTTTTTTPDRGTSVTASEPQMGSSGGGSSGGTQKKSGLFGWGFLGIL
jgi:hypothetical protein